MYHLTPQSRFVFRLGFNYRRLLCYMGLHVMHKLMLRSVSKIPTVTCNVGVQGELFWESTDLPFLRCHHPNTPICSALSRRCWAVQVRTCSVHAAQCGCCPNGSGEQTSSLLQEKRLKTTGEAPSFGVPQTLCRLASALLTGKGFQINPVMELIHNSWCYWLQVTGIFKRFLGCAFASYYWQACS